MIVKNLYTVKARVLPSTVMVLLSKFAQAVKEEDGSTMQLSSNNVFKHVYNYYSSSKSSKVKAYYRCLLKEVNHHLEQGTMVCEVNSKKLAKSKSELNLSLEIDGNSESLWDDASSLRDVTVSETTIQN